MVHALVLDLCLAGSSFSSLLGLTVSQRLAVAVLLRGAYYLVESLSGSWAGVRESVCS